MRLNLPAQPPGVGAGQTRGSSRIEEGWSPGQWGLWGPEMTPVLHGIGQGSERAPAPTQTPVCPHPDAWLGAAGEGVGGGRTCVLCSRGSPQQGPYASTGRGALSCGLGEAAASGGGEFWASLPAAVLLVHISISPPVPLVPDCVIRCPGVSPILFR